MPNDMKDADPLIAQYREQIESMRSTIRSLSGDRPHVTFSDRAIIDRSSLNATTIAQLEKHIIELEDRIRNREAING
jgi:hypothetical protein